MSLRQLAPEAEPSHRAELRDVVEDAATDPGDLVQPVAGTCAVGNDRTPNVVEVRRVVEPVSLPLRRSRSHLFRTNLVVRPKLDPLLDRSNITEVRRTDERRADEPGPGPADGAEEPLEKVVLEEHIVVEEQRVGRASPLEQRIPVLSHAPARQVPSKLDPSSRRFERPDDRSHLAC